MAAHQLSLGVELQQVVGDVCHGATGALFHQLPVGCAQAVDGGSRFSGPDVAAEALGLVDGHVELVAAGIADLEIFTRQPAQFQRN